MYIKRKLLLLYIQRVPTTSIIAPESFKQRMVVYNIRHIYIMALYNSERYTLTIGLGFQRYIIWSLSRVETL